MANYFPQLAFSIRGIKSFAATLLLAGTASMGAIAESGSAEAQAGITLKPYTAQYITKTRGISLTLDRELKRDKDGTFHLTNGGSKFVAGFKEESHFTVDNGRITPQSYVYQGTGLMNRRREVHFTPGADTVRSLHKDKWYDLPYTDNTFDRMSQLEQVRLVLMQGDTPKESVIVTVADGKRVKDYQLDYVGEETLDTPVGPIKALHFRRLHDDPDRKSDTWLAPSLDYLMVKTVHIEDGSPVEANIQSVKLEK